METACSRLQSVTAHSPKNKNPQATGRSFPIPEDSALFMLFICPARQSRIASAVRAGSPVTASSHPTQRTLKTGRGLPSPEDSALCCREFSCPARQSRIASAARAGSPVTARTSNAATLNTGRGPPSPEDSALCCREFSCPARQSRIASAARAGSPVTARSHPTQRTLNTGRGLPPPEDSALFMLIHMSGTAIPYRISCAGMTFSVRRKAGQSASLTQRYATVSPSCRRTEALSASTVQVYAM